MKLNKISFILILITILFLVYLNPVYATEKIENINITGFKEPRLWQTFESNLKEINFNNENKYEVTKITWANDENRFNLFGMYELTVCLQAKEGYEFGNYGSINVLINGENPEKGDRWVLTDISEDKSNIKIIINNVADFTVAGIIFGAIVAIFSVTLIIVIGRKIQKNKKSKPIKTYNEYVSDIQYNGVNIVVNFHIDESKNHILKDYKVLEKEGIENIIRNHFIPWLKGEDFKERDDNKIYEGLKIYYISYNYTKIIDKYSPTGEENYFGEFEFAFESSSDYTKDMLQSSAMQVYVLNDKVVKVSGYDI